MEEAVDMQKTLMQKVIDWRNTHISDSQMTLVLAFIIGFFASVAALFLHFLISQIQTLLIDGFNDSTYNFLYLLFPVVGIYLTSLFVRYIVRDNISHGITRVLYAISTKRSHLRAHNCWSSVIASAITIGFGGSVGAEAPIVLTGSAIGSNLGQLFKMDNKTLMLLVGCGGAAAIEILIIHVLHLGYLDCVDNGPDVHDCRCNKTSHHDIRSAFGCGFILVALHFAILYDGVVLELLRAVRCDRREYQIRSEEFEAAADFTADRLSESGNQP